MAGIKLTNNHRRSRMASSVARALDRIKEDLEPHLPAAMIESACRDVGHVWRRRKLGPVETIHLFVLQILHLNTAIRHLRHLAGVPVNAAAYCEARMRLPLAALQELLRKSSASLRDALGGECGGGGGGGDLTRWRGHRAFLVDGTGTAVPDTPQLRKVFKRPTGRLKGPGLPVPKVLGLFDAMTGLIVEAMAFCLFVHEASKVWLLHPLLAAGDLLVGDRGFCSYAHLALLSGRGVLGLFRINQQSQIVSFRYRRKHYDHRGGGKRLKAQRGRPRSRWVRRLGKHDQVVRWVKPRAKEGPKWMTREQFAALPDELEVREIRYRVNEKGRRTREVTIVTTLLDPALYPKASIAELYGIRWRAETHLRELKTTLGMERLKCQTEAGVRKELAAYCLAYNLVRAVMVRAAARQGVTPDRISFTDALRWLLSAAAPGEEMPVLVINPKRPGRWHPRVLKHTSRTFPKMTRERHKYRLPTKVKKPAA
jgi:hypothetical protein